jgi:hypothetical protein
MTLSVSRSRTDRTYCSVGRAVLLELTVLLVLLLTTSARLDAAYTFTDLYLVQRPAPPETTVFTLGQSAMGGNVVGWHYGSASGQNDRAILCTPGAPAGIELNPAGYTRSQAWSSSLGQQVGMAAVGSGPSHAMLWNGSAASAVDLHPAGYSDSRATGTSGARQAGYASMQSYGHAMVWSGSAASAVDLHPTGYLTSGATDVDATTVVGGAEFPSDDFNHFHAMLWSSASAASAVDLHPLSNYTSSHAYGVGGGQQVGIGEHTATGELRALLWSGSAGSVIELHPNGTTYDSSWANATNGTSQVGYVRVAPDIAYRAAVWTGSADSFVLLHSSLPANWVESYALSIDANGTIYGLALDNQVRWHAVEWTFVPEPACAMVFAYFGMIAAPRRYRRLRHRSLIDTCASESGDTAIQFLKP